MNHDNRRALLRRTAVAAGGLVAVSGAAAGGAALYRTSEEPDAQVWRMLTHPVIGTWRGRVSRSDLDEGEVEHTLLAFYPGGMMTAFTDGIHVSVGRWEDHGDERVVFGLYQVMPVDLRGLPHKYQGEVRIRHEATLSGDTLTSAGKAVPLDLDGQILATLDVSAEAERYGIALPE